MAYMLINLILAALPPTRFFIVKRHILRALGIEVGVGSKVCGGVKFFGAGKVAIGSGCWIGQNTRFYTAVTGSVTIGDNCDVAPETIFMTGSHEIGSAVRRAGAGMSKSIFVGDGCWIGVSTVLLGGVNLGASTIIAARSLLLPGHYNSNAIYAGSPARLKRELCIIND